MGLAKFMSSTTGRWVRILAGAALIAIGLLLVSGVWGIVLVVVGAVPFLAIIVSLRNKDKPIYHRWVDESTHEETLEEQWHRELEEGNPIRRMQMLDALEHPDSDF